MFPTVPPFCLQGFRPARLSSRVGPTWWGSGNDRSRKSDEPPRVPSGRLALLCPNGRGRMVPRSEPTQFQGTPSQLSTGLPTGFG